jgi:transposase
VGNSDALGAAASQLGPQLQGAIVELNKGVGAPYGKIRRVLKSIFGIEVSAAGCAQVVLRAGRRLAPVHEILKQVVARRPCVSVDETGWRVGGTRRGFTWWRPMAS